MPPGQETGLPLLDGQLIMCNVDKICPRVVEAVVHMVEAAVLVSPDKNFPRLQKSKYVTVSATSNVGTHSKLFLWLL